MDGFDILRSFHPKEISIVNLHDADGGSVFTGHYRVDESLVKAPGVAKHARFVTNYVHGLPIANVPDDRPYSEFLATLRFAIDDAIATDSLIGYKGGNHERDILTELGGADNAINIELLGCPKFEFIYRDFRETVDAYPSCARHARIANKKMCSRVKSFAYTLWLRANRVE